MSEEHQELAEKGGSLKIIEYKTCFLAISLLVAGKVEKQNDAY